MTSGTSANGGDIAEGRPDARKHRVDLLDRKFGQLRLNPQIKFEMLHFELAQVLKQYLAQIRGQASPYGQV
jgi:hypothetical protein